MFTPNWQRMGFKSKMEGMMHVFQYLKENESHIVRTGFSDEVSLMYGDIVLVLKGKGKEMKKNVKKDTKKQLDEQFHDQ